MQQTGYEKVSVAIQFDFCTLSMGKAADVLKTVNSVRNLCSTEPDVKPILY